MRIFVLNIVTLLFFISLTNGSLENAFVTIKKTGEYESYSESFKLIRGTKKNNITEAYMVMSFAKSLSGTFVGNVTVFEEIGPLLFQSKAESWNTTDNKYVERVKYAARNACSSDVYRTLVFGKFVKFTKPEEKCFLKKGTVQLNDMDVNAFFQALTGGKFFYGKSKISLYIYTAKYNVLSFEMIVDFRRLKARE